MTDKKSPSIVSAKDVKSMRYQTPYFLLNESKLTESLNLYKKCFPDTEICYAMKANSEPEVLKIIKDQGFGFEVASSYELALLRRIKVSPEKILYGTSVKPSKQIREFVKYGVNRFAFDSEQEVDKLAKYAPGARVYLRVLVDDGANSVFTMSEKFGVDANRAEDLLIYAREKGLRPYGISFNVGSQARNPKAWANGIIDLIPFIESLDKSGIRLDMINLGGGYPYKYLPNDGISTLEEIGKYTREAISKLPYDLKIIVEPGRGIIAHPMVLVVSVIAKVKRDNGNWLYLDGGAYNALLEAMSYQGSTRYETSTVKEYSGEKTEKFILTGPTGDSLDIIDPTAVLPGSIDIGDKLIIHDTGAYSLVLSTPFNGFPKPKVHSI